MSIEEGYCNLEEKDCYKYSMYIKSCFESKLDLIRLYKIAKLTNYYIEKHNWIFGDLHYDVIKNSEFIKYLIFMLEYTNKIENIKLILDYLLNEENFLFLNQDHTIFQQFILTWSLKIGGNMDMYISELTKFYNKELSYNGDVIQYLSQFMFNCISFENAYIGKNSDYHKVCQIIANKFINIYKMLHHEGELENFYNKTLIKSFGILCFLKEKFDLTFLENLLSNVNILNVTENDSEIIDILLSYYFIYAHNNKLTIDPVKIFHQFINSISSDDNLLLEFMNDKEIAIPFLIYFNLLLKHIVSILDMPEENNIKDNINSAITFLSQFYCKLKQSIEASTIKYNINIVLKHLHKIHDFHNKQSHNE